MLLLLKYCIFTVLTGKDRDVGEVLVRSLQNTKFSINEKLANSTISLFSQKSNMSSKALHDAQGGNVDIEQDFKTENSDKDQSKQVVEAGTIDEENNETDTDGSESSDHDSDNSGSDQENGDVTDGKDTLGDHFKEHVEFHGGRVRRRAVFGNDVDQNDLKVSLKLFLLN